MSDTDIREMTEKALAAMAKYLKDHPDVKVDRDYYPFKLTEEWGECMQAYLMLTDRGRQKGLTKDEIHAKLENEFADVLGFLLLFARAENIDIPAAMDKKWFAQLRTGV